MTNEIMQKRNSEINNITCNGFFTVYPSLILKEGEITLNSDYGYYSDYFSKYYNIENEVNILTSVNIDDKSYNKILKNLTYHFLKNIYVFYEPKEMMDDNADNSLLIPFIYNRKSTGKKRYLLGCPESGHVPPIDKLHLYYYLTGQNKMDNFLYDDNVESFIRQFGEEVYNIVKTS